MPQQQQTHLYFGLDLGKRQDFSALALIEYSRAFEMVRNPVTWALEQILEEPRFSVRQLSRLPLETKYMDVAAQVQDLLIRATRKYDCTLVVDATGVGQPVVEMFYSLPNRSTLVPVVITGGESESRTKDEWRVPRKDLLAGLQVMLETGALAIAEGLECARAFEEELLEFRENGDSNPGVHDDLIMAVALACWRARRHDMTATQGFKGKDPGIYGAGSPPSVWGKTRLF